MDKRGWAYSSSRSWLSLGLGIICILVGLVPLLALLNVAPVLSSIPIPALVVEIILFIGGIFLLYDSFAVRSIATGRIKGPAILAGILLAVIGAIPLALELKLLSFLPFVVDLKIPPYVLYGLLVFYGFYLVVDAFIVRDTRFF